MHTNTRSCSSKHRLSELAAATHICRQTGLHHPHPHTLTPLTFTHSLTLTRILTLTNARDHTSTLTLTRTQSLTGRNDDGGNARGRIDLQLL